MAVRESFMALAPVDFKGPAKLKMPFFEPYKQLSKVPAAVNATFDYPNKLKCLLEKKRCLYKIKLSVDA